MRRRRIGASLNDPDSRKNEELLPGAHELDADDARKWRDHPAQFWLERAITTGYPHGAARQARTERHGVLADGSGSAKVCFDARTAEEHPDVEWVTLEDPRAQAVIGEPPRCVPELPLPIVRAPDFRTPFPGFGRFGNQPVGRRLQPAAFLTVFVNDAGRTFLPTAKRIGTSFSRSGSN